MGDFHRERCKTVKKNKKKIPSIQMIIGSLTHVDHLTGGLLRIANKKRLDTT